MQDFWNSWHVAHAQSWRDLFFTNAIRFPEGTSLAYHSFAWPQVFAVALLARLFGDSFATIVTLQNLDSAGVLSAGGRGMFYLARHLLGDGRDLGAAVAGFVFAFNPWHVAQVMHHAHVAGSNFCRCLCCSTLRALGSKKLALAGRRRGHAGAERPLLLVFPVLHALFLRLPSSVSAPARWPLAPRLAAGGAGPLHRRELCCCCRPG